MIPPMLPAWSKPQIPNVRRARRGAGSHVDVGGFLRVLHDEAEARRRVLAHQLVDHAIGLERVRDVDAEGPPATSASSVVSQSTFGIISPRPLKRVISPSSRPCPPP